MLAVKGFLSLLDSIFRAQCLLNAGGDLRNTGTVGAGGAFVPAREAEADGKAANSLGGAGG
jgi:hypothetical protein